MAKRKKATKVTDEDIEKFAGGDYTFFGKEVDRHFDGNVKVSDVSELKDPKANSTGSMCLDYDLAIPFAEGSIVEVYGAEGSMKTSLALQTLAEALHEGKDALFVDAERSLNKRHMSGIARIRPWLEPGYIGPKNNTLKVVRTNTGEQALETMRMFASQFPKSVIVLDSVDACLPEALITGEIGEQKIGNVAKLMSDALRKLVGVANDNGVTLIFVNQIRSKIIAYGDPNESSGGRALKFYAHQRIELMKPGKAQVMMDSDGERIGIIMRYKVIKNKYAPFGAEGEIPILYHYGFYDAQELLKMCLDFGILSFGGRGGGQVKMPKWNSVPMLDDDGNPMVDDTGEAIIINELETDEEKFVSRPKVTAAKLLANDKQLYDIYKGRLEALLDGSNSEDTEDGVLDTEKSDSSNTTESE